MKKFAEAKRRPLEFSVGDKVMLKLPTKILRKFRRGVIHKWLIPKYDGPFEIVKRVGNVAYRLKLPERLKVHLTFLVSLLKVLGQYALLLCGLWLGLGPWSLCC
jgi:hypothetical protein